MKQLGILLLMTRTALASPCEDAVIDPAATPLRDASLDAQRGGCLRDELAAAITTHALIDTPGFHGVVGGDLALAGRIAWRRFELGARVRVVDYAFVQTAVTKVTATRLGPLGISAAYGGRLGERAVVAVVLAGELPYTRDDMATLHAGGELAAVVTGEVADRWLVHARLGILGAVAASDAGSTTRLGLRAGADVAWRVRPRLSLHAGAETQAGWFGGLDTVLARSGLHVRFARALRGRIGIGVPLAGNDRTTAIVELGIARDL